MTYFRALIAALLVVVVLLPVLYFLAPVLALGLPILAAWLCYICLVRGVRRKPGHR